MQSKAEVCPISMSQGSLVGAFLTELSLKVGETDSEGQQFVQLGEMV